jgi:hypothetical protein
MISIYTSAFNLVKNKFNYEFHINNFCDIADEVVVCVNTSDDNTFEVLKKAFSSRKNLKIIKSDFSYDDPMLDGKIKNRALQNTTKEIKVGLDMDEYIPLWQKDIWIQMSKDLLKDDCLCYMVASINLYKDKDHYFSITPKWYIHKSGLYRGPQRIAIKPDGHINTKISDGCELVDYNNNLVYSKRTVWDVDQLRTNQHPFVVHTGYISLENRLLRNENFWSEHWLTESGGDLPAHKIHKSMDDFNEEHYKHGLLL